MKLIAVDPASKSTGLAIFEDGVLVLAWSTTPQTAALAIQSAMPDKVALEMPEHQRGRPTSISALITLSVVAGHLKGVAASTGAEIIEYSPNQWKGTDGKEITKARANTRLSPQERETVQDSKSDTWDAIGIGLVALGRARRGVTW